MLSNISPHILLFLIISIFIIFIGVVVGVTIRIILKSRQDSDKKRRIFISIFMSLLSIFIAAISWLLNMGWVRMIMTLLLIPFIHALIFFFTNLFMTYYEDKNKSTKLLNLLFILTYLLLYIFLPDGADTGEMYFFFGLIHSNSLSGIAQCVSRMAFLGHIVLFILQIIQAIRTKKKGI